MTRTFSTPAAFKASLEERLRSRAAATGSDLQRLRQLVVYDRFLARLFDGSAGDVVLKGGLALELRCERARATKDVDLRMMGAPDAALERLQEVGRRVLGDFLHFEIVPDPKHATIETDGLVYEGRRYRVQAMLAGKLYGRPFGTDVAFAEPLVGEPETLVDAHGREGARLHPPAATPELPGEGSSGPCTPRGDSHRVGRRGAHGHRRDVRPPRDPPGSDLPAGPAGLLTAPSNGRWAPREWMWRDGLDGLEPENAEIDAIPSPVDDR